MPTTTPTLDALLQHDPFVRRLARSLLSDANDADDLVQETWLAAVRRPPEHLGAPRGWLSRVTRNLAATGHRRRSARLRWEAEAPAGGDVPRPDEIAEREETRRRVLQALLALEEPYRSTLLLRYYEDLPPRVVATRMGDPVETVRTRVKRGLARLRAELDDGTEAERRRRWTALAAWAVPTATASSSFPWVAAGLVAAALLVVGAAFFLHRDDAGGGPPPDEAEEEARDATGPRLVGRGDAARPTSAVTDGDDRESAGGATTGDATLLAQFEVVGPDGAAVEGAIVYAVPRRLADQGLLPGLPRGETDEAGLSELRLYDPKQWIVRVLAHGYGSAEFEGAALATGATQRVRLKRAPPTKVVVRRADGEPLTKPVHLRLTSRVDRPTSSVGGLGDYVIRKDLTQLFDVPVSGEVTLGFTVPLPALLTLDPGFPTAWAAAPSEILVERHVERLDLQLVRSARIGLRLYDGDTEDAPRWRGTPVYELTSEGSGETRKTRFIYREHRVLPNVLDLVSHTPLGPGRYALEVRVPGWRPWRRGGIDLPRPESQVDLVARLEAEPAKDTALHVTLPEAVRTERFFPHAVSARRKGAADGAWTEFGALHVTRVGGPTEWMVVGLEEGTWDLLLWVWNGAERRVAGLHGVRVGEGEAQHVVAETTPGLCVRLTPDAPNHERFERVTLRSPELGVLPLREFPRDRFSGRLDDFAWAAPEPHTVLGPYPVALVEVEAEAWHGKTYRHAVRPGNAPTSPRGTGSRAGSRCGR